MFWGYFFKKYFFVEKLRQLQKNICGTSETKQKYIIRHVLTNLKSCNWVNPQFVAFLRLPLSIQKYLGVYIVPFSTVLVLQFIKTAYFSLGIRMKDRQP